MGTMGCRDLLPAEVILVQNTAESSQAHSLAGGEQQLGAMLTQGEARRVHHTLQESQHRNRAERWRAPKAPRRRAPDRAMPLIAAGNPLL